MRMECGDFQCMHARALSGGADVALCEEHTLIQSDRAKQRFHMKQCRAGRATVARRNDGAFKRARHATRG